MDKLRWITSVKNNRGFSSLENIIAVGIFTFVIFELLLATGRMRKDQSNFQSRTIASQIADLVTGDLTVVNIDYSWLQPNVNHLRYFDSNGNETATSAAAKFTVEWTVLANQPMLGMKTASLHLFWKEESKDENLFLRVTR